MHFHGFLVVLFRSVSFVNNSLYINHIWSLVPSALLSLLGYYYWFIDFLFPLNFISLSAKTFHHQI